MRRGAAFALAAALLAAPALASAAVDPPPDPADAAYQQCIETSDGTDPAWARCGGAYMQAEEARLNEVWRQVYGALKDASKPLLLAEQRAWIAYKDASCAYYSSADFGRTGEALNFPACRGAVVAARVAYLQSVGGAEALSPP